MSKSELPLAIAVKQESCSNCIHCSKPNFFGDSDEWMCRAKENLSLSYNFVTGESIAINKFCYQIRELIDNLQNTSILSPINTCAWHSPERLYNSDGISVSVRELNRIKEARDNKPLSKTTLEDLI